MILKPRTYIAILFIVGHLAGRYMFAQAPQYPIVPSTGSGSGGLTIGTTTISGGGTNCIVYSDGTLLQCEAAVTRSAASQLTFSKAAIGTTPFDSIILINPTAAAAGLQQESPAYNRCGFGWKTTATAASQSVCVRDYLLPVQGTTVPTSRYNLDFSANGSGYINVFGVSSDSSGTVGNGTLFMPSNISLLNTGINFLTVSGGAGNVAFKMNGTPDFSIYGPNGVNLGKDSIYGWAAGADGSGAQDTSMFRSAAGVIAAGQGSTTANGSFKTTHLMGAGTVPSLTSGFGTSPSLSGTDLVGTLTIGTGGTANTGLITFGQSYGVAPSCFAEDISSTILKLVPVTTTTQMTINAYSPAISGGFTATSFGAGDTVKWFCGGG